MKHGETLDNSLAVFCLMHVGVNLEEIEAFITRLETEGVGAGRELRETLNEAKAAKNVKEVELLIKEVARRRIEIMREEYLLPLAKVGVKHKSEQRGRASGDRSSKLKDKPGDKYTLNDIIKDLAGRCDELGDYVPAPELWETLYAELDEAKAEPSETRNNSFPRKTSYSYFDINGNKHTIARNTFENKITKIRKKLSR